MADKKITQLNNITGADLAEADEFVVVDITADETKAITFSELKTAFDTSTGFVRITGDTMTGDLSFGDNDKAIFGAGSDLQIYHTTTGNHSIIAESGAGNLIVAADNFEINNAANNANKITATTGGAVTLYNNNSAKLATTSTGIDVTGTVTSDGLETLHTSGDVGYRLGYNSGSSAYIHRDSATGHYLLQSDETGSSWKIETDNGSGPLTRLEVDRYGDISFYEDTGSTAKFFWDASAESLGIGTTSPATGYRLDVLGNSGYDDIMKIVGVGTNIGPRINLTPTGTGISRINATANSLQLQTSGTSALTIDSSQNVGIGTSSPTTSLDVVRAGVQPLRVQSTSGTEVQIHMVNTGGNVQLEAHNNNFNIDADAVGIGNSNPSAFNSLGATDKLVIGDSTVSNLTLFGTNYGSLAFADSNTSGSTAQYAGLIQYYHADNSMQFYTSSTERMRINSSGNVGIGTSSPATDGKLTIHGTDTDSGILLSRSSGNDVAIHNIGGTLAFRTGGESTTLGGLTERMRIDSSGNVGILNSVASTITTANSRNGLVVGSGSGNNGVTIYSGNTSNSSIMFADATSGSGTYIGQINYDHNADAMLFSTTAAERMRIDSSGNLLVGTTDPLVADSTNGGIVLGGQRDLLHVSRVNQPPVKFSRANNDGDIAVFAKNGATVGSIGTLYGDIYVGTGDTGLKFTDSSNVIVPLNTSTLAERDAAVSLGQSGTRFKDLYLSGGVYLGGTVAANKLDDYEEGTWTPVAAGSSSSGTASYSIQGGNYTKIGNMVYIMGRLGWSGHTGSGNLIVNGLPFSSVGDYAFLGFSFRDALTITAGKTAYVYVKPSSATAAFIEIGTGTSATSGVAMDTAVSDVSFSGFYRVP